jgi:prefoldin subunit 5
MTSSAETVLDNEIDRLKSEAEDLMNDLQDLDAQHKQKYPVLCDILRKIADLEKDRRAR